MIRYNFLKDKDRFTERKRTYLEIGTNYLTSMFNWELPENTDILPQLIETILISEGKGAFFEDSGKWFFGSFSYGGEDLDVNGLAKNGVVTCRNGKTKTGEIGVDIFPIWNNMVGTPENSLYYFADLLSEIDISILANIRFSRNNKIIEVSNAKEKTIIDEVLKNSKIGKIETVVSGSGKIKNAFTEDTEEGATSLDLFNVKDTDKMQYLSHFHDDTLARAFFLYGMTFNNGTKMAQQSVEEIQSNDNASLIYPDIMLRSRQKWLKPLEQFGFSVDFSKNWKQAEAEATAEETEEKERSGEDGNTENEQR